jgi:glutathionylspermidine synthase
MYNYQQFLDNNPNYPFEKYLNWLDLGLGITQLEFDSKCQQIANFVDQKSIELMQDDKQLSELTYPKNSLKYLDTDLSIMRFGFLVDQNKSLNLIEINSQTPSFFWECHDGLKNNYKVESAIVETYKNTLINYFQNVIKIIDIKLNRVIKPSIGIVCCENPDDLFQMNYVQDLIAQTNLVDYMEVLTIQNLDINGRNLACSMKTAKEFDILMFWYPIEWLAVENFGDGSPALESIFDLVKQNKLHIINGMQSFVVQNKEFLAKIYESPDCPSFVTPSFYTKEEFEQEFDENSDFIAKPIFGREGQGIFGQKSGEIFEGDLSDSYYTDQNYVYQPLIQTLDLVLDDKSYKYTLEKWVVKINGKWFSAGHSLRVNNEDSLIVDNDCKWLPIN